MKSTLEKIRRLEQYLASNHSSDDPVLDQTIDKLLERERTRLRETKARLEDQLILFEKQYGLTSTAFYRKYQNGEIDDDMDFVEWAATFEIMTNIEKRLSLLEIDAPS